MRATEFNILVQKYLTGTITPTDRTTFFQLLADPAYEEQLLDLIGKDLEADSYTIPHNENQLQQLIQSLREKRQKPAGPVPRIHFTRYWMAAASVILLLGIGTYFLTTHKQNAPGSTLQTTTDISPGKNGATLILADGSLVALDSLANGIIADQQGTQIVLRNGELTYNAKQASAPTYNTIKTSRGRQYQLVLPDESRVWLNAESSIQFPTAFSGKERSVTITGEAYFEISGNKEKPFIVKTPGDEIIVLGTSFNTNCYPDETSKTSLVEGAIKIRGQLLKPGEAFLNGKIIKTDISRDIAWKNGFFNFNEVDLESMLRQIARWYDIDIEYKGIIPQRTFGGRMRRDLNLSEVLKLLDNLNITYHLSGKKLTIQ